MRYFELLINASVEQIESSTKIRLKDYSYEGTISAVNSFLYKTLRSGVCFFIFREEAKGLRAILSYDEKAETFESANKYVMDVIHDSFGLRRLKFSAEEITMFQMDEYYNEGRRRDFLLNGIRYLDATNLFLHDFFRDEAYRNKFDFKETVVKECGKEISAICDAGYLKEINNIETHINKSGYAGNMVHYVISARSLDAAIDMTELLAQSLAKANRISGRRMDIITSIDPDVYKGKSYLEDIIENNAGGIVVFDLTEKFGSSTVEYGMTCTYLEKLLKKYKNDCLFVFVYNMDAPGFAYTLLPELKKYVIPVMLKEGTGDRKAAVTYMRDLIRNSDYAKYANQAEEFMAQFPGDKFTQTDILMAFEQFEAWCLNKNVLKAYGTDFAEDFMLDRDENAKSSYDRLQSLIGLKTVKEQIDRIIVTDLAEKERRKRLGSSYNIGTMHMIFTGNPGTAKTTVAKLFAGIAKEKGILKSGAFVEYTGSGEKNGFNGLRDAFTRAKGGVLFIDEAYDFDGEHFVTVLIQEMENHREEVIVILAGYSDRMKAYMEINEGLKSRAPFTVEFPDYDEKELTEIFKHMLNERGFTATEEAIKSATCMFEKVKNVDNFGNGRYVRNLLEKAVQNQAERIRKENGSFEMTLNKDLFLIKDSDITMLDEGLVAGRKSGTAKKELEEMIGLESAKDIIEKAIASYKFKKICMDRGIAKDKASLHMAFTGNPGSAKTTVARLFAEIMKDEKVLSTGNFVEVLGSELISPLVGMSSRIVKKKFREAQGGVLFIDEAYSLCDGGGDEAIDTIVQEMENHRDKVIVIFAGYPEPMKKFLERNPGLSSRVAFHIPFDDYNEDELCEITKLMVKRKQMKITDKAMEKLRGIYKTVVNTDDYGNGRYVRKVLEEAEMNLARRLMKCDESELTDDVIITIEECDITVPKKAAGSEKFQMGFVS